jgi:TPR repeat protein
MFCTKCGYQIKDGYKFCPKCGTPAYVAREESKVEVKAEVDEVTKEENGSVDSEPVVKTYTTKKTAKANTASESKKKKAGSTPNKNYPPNPLIAEELDIEGVMKKAEQGDREAMLRQAFRYEMGIGVEKDIKKAEDLYNKAGGKGCIITSSASMYVFGVELKENLNKASK